jgi:hypothetical protein
MDVIKSMQRTKAYQRGVLDFANGMPYNVESNPYTSDTIFSRRRIQNFMRWNVGWLDAHQYSMGFNESNI